jgi:hypothetical protein
VSSRLESVTRYYALLIGVAFVLAGLAGFIPFFAPAAASHAPHLAIDTSYGYLLGLFPVNIVHNLFHLTLAVWGLLAWRHYASARTYCRALAVILGVLTLLGLIPDLNTIFGLMPVFGHAIWLHGLEAIIGAYLGFVASAETVPPTTLSSAS